jgi:anti-anti-sigma regulatory factor
MSMIAECLKIDEKHLVASLAEAEEKLETAEGEVVLDISSVWRIDTEAVRALQQFASTAQKKTVKVVLRGAQVNVYKVLKLMKLTSRFSFES